MRICRMARRYGTPGTAAFLSANGVPTTTLHKPDSHTEPNVMTLLRERAIDLVINDPQVPGPHDF